MKTSDVTLASLVVKLGLSVAAAATIGGGTAIIHSASANAVQDQRIVALEQDRAEMHELSAKLDETNRNVAVLNERLNHEVARDGK